MAMMGSSAWNGQEQGMHGAHDDDFQFLDLNGINLGDGLNFDLGDFQNPTGSHILQSQPREPVDITMGGTEGGPIMSRQHSAIHTAQMHHPVAATGVSHPSVPTIPSSMMPMPVPTAAIDEIDAQIQYLQQQKMQQQQRQFEARQQQAVAYYATGQRQIIPPTPQSMELQAGTQFYTVHDHQPPQPPSQQQHHQQQASMYERYQRVKEQDMTFTPLVSPAVTPLETHFPHVENQYTVPGAYFSPLTSPALVAQSDHHSLIDKRIPANSTSPCEMEPESFIPPPALSETGRRTKKTAVSKARKANVRQSPISKPQRRKNSSVTPLMNAQVLDQLAETLEVVTNMQPLPPPAPITTGSTSTPAATGSENDSVSPEHLSEMPPPPVPKSRSARPSPYIQAQSSAQPVDNLAPKNGKPSPATPASLMKLPSPSVTAPPPPGSQDAATTDVIENFELPEAVNTAFLKRPAAVAISNSQTSSPVIDPSSTPKISGFQPLPSPSFVRPSTAASASQSPQLAPGNSGSTSASTPTNPRKTPQMLPRGSKKRGSISSVQVSPALLPRISPNIKPLLPGGSTAEDHASRLLASKSNYQNIIEGNTVPGVNYPSALATNLTSKRTSHKIAEQGRRNRINTALQEMSALLPRDLHDAKISEEGEGGDKKDKSGNLGPNSKASTVEMAIEYIKQLQSDLAEAQQRIAAADLKADSATLRADEAEE